MNRYQTLAEEIHAHMKAGRTKTAGAAIRQAMEWEVAQSKEATQIAMQDIQARNERTVDQLNFERKRNSELAARANQAETQIKEAGKSVEKAIARMIEKLLSQRELIRSERAKLKREKQKSTKKKKCTR